MINLSAAGLNETEAKCYTALLERAAWKPAELAEYVNETRTNCYKLLDNLVAKGLAERFDKDKKYHYRATNPSRLLELAREERLAREAAEQQLAAGTQSLFAQYIHTQEQASVQFFQGKDELKNIYDDQINTGQPIYIIRPDFNMDLYDFSFMTEIRQRARRAGIQRYAISPDRVKAPKNYKESDPFMLLKRTWMNAGDYTAPVEWNAYGDKVAIMSFGNEATGIIVQSPQIAEAFRQIYRMLEKGLRLYPGYDKLPLHAAHIGATQESSQTDR